MTNAGLKFLKLIKFFPQYFSNLNLFFTNLGKCKKAVVLEDYCPLLQEVRNILFSNLKRNI